MPQPARQPKPARDEEQGTRMAEAFQATRERRQYSRWVADETIEDFALRFTARRARRWSYGRVANTAIGSISFLALEAIGAAVTLSWGFDIAVAAILWGGLILFITALPISYYAARYGVDIDLLTRGAGFGYLGSTLTSLIYACFTFIFFALEAAILATALKLVFGIPLSIGYVLSSLAIIPLVMHGFRKISGFQAITQPVWIVLHVLPFLLIGLGGHDLPDWTGFTGQSSGATPSLLAFGAASGVVLALIAQVGEQVDILRFLPEPRSRREHLRWWLAVVAAGPGWAVLGTVKMLLGSWLVTLVPLASVDPDVSHAIDPTQLYHAAFSLALPEPAMALALTGIFVILSQLKINVTNAYAGSIAWSNFFSRITHAHPGRVVWLFFNVAIALLLMELGVFAALEVTLSVYSHVALAWIGALFADLTVNKPLGLSPRGIEFRRAHLYDVNPVGTGAMFGGTVLALLAHTDFAGPQIEALSPFVALGSSGVLAVVITWATSGRYYIARPAPVLEGDAVRCCLCDYSFDREDMTNCPFYAAPICSLCCSLNASCGDACKPEARLDSVIARLAEAHLPVRMTKILDQRLVRFGAVTLMLVAAAGGVVLVIRQTAATGDMAALDAVLALILASSVIIIGIAVWLFLLSREARQAAMRDSERQTERLRREIRAHERTDRALQAAKEQAESASQAKTRYMAGLSHELRTPLNAIYGYAQILDADPRMPPDRHEAVRAIRRSSEHLAGLIEGLLDISKIEAGRLELTRTRVNLPDLLRQIVDIFRDSARRQGLEFRVEPLTKLPEWVLVDEKRLRQIVINLLANAFRYTCAGGVTLRIGWRNQVATVEVEDSGIGIMQDDLERIWNPFERGRDPALPRGTGLGLTITRLLVDVLGGDISVTSTPGRGSLFRLKLYLADAPSPRVDPGQAPLRAQGQDYDGRRRLVMIVDDDLPHLALMETYLRQRGFNTVTAAHALAAQDLLGELRPDLFLVDIDMPGLDGWGLVQWLRVNGHPATPILILSGHALEAQTGAPDLRLHDGFIAKPLILDDLLSRIDGLLKLERHVPDAAAEDDLAHGAALLSHPPAAASARAAPLSADDVRKLRELAQIGHLRGLRSALVAAPLPAGLQERLSAALEMADFERVLDVLDEHADEAVFSRD